MNEWNDGTNDNRSVYGDFMAPRVMAVLVLVLLLPLASVAQQAGSKPASSGAYVVVWQGSKEFHSSSCPLIKDAKGVSVLTRAQASGKGYTQHKDCDPATIAEKNAPPTVMVAESDKVYHKADCKVLPKDAKKVTLDEKAVKGRWPCTVCRPPIRPTGPKAFNR
jgi:hypothetical protein